MINILYVGKPILQKKGQNLNPPAAHPLKKEKKKKRKKEKI
jgi:hypothetical protein